MKGIVFTEFLRFVEQRYGEDMVDDIIDDCPLKTGGAYTAVGTYDHAEMKALCKALSLRSATAADELTCRFGHQLAATFEQGHSEFFRRSATYFDFLASVEDHIHQDVRKLYPEAELPTFTLAERGERRMVIDYRSPRRLGALARGLIEGTALHYGVAARVTAEPPDCGSESVRFTIDID